MFNKFLENTIYLEKILISEFTFGFELEAYFDNDETYNLKSDSEIYDYVKKFFDDRFKDAETIDHVKSDITHDASLETEERWPNLLAFEWKSPAFTFTPKNVILVINILKKVINSSMFYIDETCAFHIHLGFPSYSNEADKELNMLWIILNLALSIEYSHLEDFDTEIFNKIVKFKNIKLFDDIYAPVEPLHFLADELKAKILKDDKIGFYFMLSTMYNSHKNQLLRIHPQGTLEWRGPRGFLHSDDALEDTKDFFMKVLYPYISWITKILDKDFIKIKEDFVVSKKDIYNVIIKEKNLLNRDTTFSKKTKNKDKQKALSMYSWLRPTAMKYENVEFHFDKNNNFVTTKGLFKDGIWKDGIINTGRFFKIVFSGKNIVIYSRGDSEYSLVKIFDSKIENISSCSFAEIASTYIFDGEFDNSKIFDSNIMGETAYFDNCTIENSSIRRGYFENCSIISTTVYLINTFKKTNFRNVRLFKGYLKDCRINDGLIYDIKCDKGHITKSKINEGNYKGVYFIECNITGNPIFDKDCVFVNCNIDDHLSGQISDDQYSSI